MRELEEACLQRHVSAAFWHQPKARRLFRISTITAIAIVHAVAKYVAGRGRTAPAELGAARRNMC